jgi:hypothetical protein
VPSGTLTPPSSGRTTNAESSRRAARILVALSLAVLTAAVVSLPAAAATPAYGRITGGDVVVAFRARTISPQRRRPARRNSSAQQESPDHGLGRRARGPGGPIDSTASRPAISREDLTWDSDASAAWRSLAAWRCC